MATTNVTVSMEAALLDQVRAEAAAAGISVSAWMARAARAFARRDRAKRHRAWLEAHPEISEELQGFEAFARRTGPGRSALGDPE